MYWVSQLRGCNSPLVSIVVTRMQGLASEYSKIFSGVIPPDPTPNNQPDLWPVLGPKPWSPLTFQPWLRPWHRHADVLLWPLPWPDYLNIRTWPEYSADVLACQIWTF